MQATHARRKQEGDKSEKNSESKETSEAPIPVPARQQRPSRVKPPPNAPPLKGKARKSEGPFLVDNENFSETSVLSNSATVDFAPLAANRSAEEIGVQTLINESIVDNMLPAINNRFNDDSFHPISDFGKVALPAGNNNFGDIASSQGYGTYITSSMQTTNTNSAIDSGVVMTTNIGNIGPADSSKGAFFTPLNTQEAVNQFNSTGTAQEITRVTLSSVHKVEGNKELTPIRAASSFINNSTAPGNIIEKTIGHTDTSMFDVPINKDGHTMALYNIDTNNRTDNTIIQTNPMINAGSHGLQSNTQSHLVTYDSERSRSFECGGSASNTHLIGVAGPSEIPSNLQPIADQSSTKTSGQGRPKKTTAASRGRPKKVKPNETQIGVEGITTEIKSVGNLPEAEGLSAATVNDNKTKIKHGKRGRPSKITQTGGLVTNPTDGTIVGSTNVPKKRGRPKKEETNNEGSNVNLAGTTIGKASKRGRPRKFPKVESHLTKGTKHNGRGRPRKVPKDEDQREKSTTGIKKRGRPRKEVSENSEPRGVPEGSELKASEIGELPENSELKQVPESSELREVPESSELKEAPENSELKEVPGYKGEPTEAVVDAKTGKRGRPKKVPISGEPLVEPGKEPSTSKKRGRPKKEASENDGPKTTNAKAGKRGRPRKKPRDEEPSVSSNEPGAASGPVEHQLATENVPDNNTSSISAVDVGGTNVTISEVPVEVADEVPEESIDELIDELTTTN